MTQSILAILLALALVAPAAAVADDWRSQQRAPGMQIERRPHGDAGLRDRYDYRFEQRERNRAAERQRPTQPGYPDPIVPGDLYRDYPHNQRHHDNGRHPGSYGYPPPPPQPYRHPSIRVYTGSEQGTVYRSYEQQRGGSTLERSTLGPQRGAPQRGVNDVIDMVERRYGGKVVGVENAGDHYRVRLLQRDGRVRTLQVPSEGY